MLNDKHVIFRLVVLHFPHASYAYKNYWLCDRCDRNSLLKNQLPPMTSKRRHHLITLLMLIGMSIQQRLSVQRWHRLKIVLDLMVD